MKRSPCALMALLSLAMSASAQQQRVAPPAAPAAAIAIRAGRLVDPDTGTAAANQIIVVQDGKISAVGGNVTIPAGAQVIDLSAQTVLPGQKTPTGVGQKVVVAESDKNVLTTTFRAEGA